jgi:hypothetical protein
MLIVFLFIVLAAAGPLGLEYWKNPEDNILTRSKEEATEGVREIVSELSTTVSVAAESTLHHAIRELLVALFLAAKRWFISLFSDDEMPRLR